MRSASVLPVFLQVTLGALPHHGIGRPGAAPDSCRDLSAVSVCSNPIVMVGSCHGGWCTATNTKFCYSA